MATKKPQTRLTVREWTLLACRKLGGGGQRGEVIEEIKRMRRFQGHSTNPVNPPFSQMKADGLFYKNTEWGYWQLTQKGRKLAEKTNTLKAPSVKLIKARQNAKTSAKRRTKDSCYTHNQETENKAINFILKNEREWKRTTRNHPGFDLYQGSLGNPTKVCEVKSRSIDANSTTLTPKQTETAMRYRNKYWVYLVSNVGTPSKTRVEKIQNPAKNWK